MSDENRRQKRFDVERVACNLGDIVDLSPGGARVLTTSALSGSPTLILQTARQGKVRLRTRVQWHRRLGFRQHVVGLAFEHLSTLEKRAVGSLVDQASRGWSPATVVPRRRNLAAATLALGLLISTLGYLLADRPQWLIGVLPGGWVERIMGYRDPVTLTAFAAGGVLALLGVALLMRKPTAARRDPADRRAAPPGSGGTGPTTQAGELVQLRRSQHVLNCILESSLGGVVVLKALRDSNRSVRDLEIQLVNPAAEQLIGKPAKHLVASTVAKQLPCLADHALYRDLISVVESGLPLNQHYHLEKSRRWYQLAVVQLGDGLAVTFADATDQHQAQEKLRHVAYHDELTSLPNRKLLMEHLEKAFHRAKRFPDHRCAVLFLDFDRFKFVNDTLGHEVGDLLLINIARRLRENIRGADTAAIAGQEQISARLGGDEFVVLLDGVKGEAQVTAVARRLLEAFNQPHQLDGHTVVSTASIGIAMSREEYAHVDELLRDADTAMYQAKHSGKARYVVFDQHMHEKIIAEAELEKDLREAVKAEAFELVYEPVVDLKSGRVAGFEALIRWSHERQGQVPPDQFIPLAEQLNLILPIGDWVLRQACAELQSWQDAGQDEAFVNINLSRAQLYDDKLIETLKREIEKRNLAPGNIRLEITETMVMHEAAAMTAMLGRLKELGVQIALDDFGTGHSSLNVLHELPLDILKIDKSFVENAGRSVRRYGAIIATITELARNLGMRVIAEGIERPEQVALLKTLECDFAQGYLFSRPVRSAEALRMLGEGRRFDVAA